jgi:lipopolysaccharide/colanic/teichoic acid biosynthesis glycosyltransferase
VPLAGPLKAAPEWGRRHKVHYALIAMPSLKRPELLAVLEDCGASFRHVILLPDLFGMASLWVNARDLGGLLGLEVRQNLLSPLNRTLKRLLDVCIALPAAMFALPVIALAALWIRRVSPGNPFYAQQRGGEAGRTIRVYKLRTMYPNADQILDRYLREHPEACLEWQRTCKLKDDPRLLPRIGKLLRRTSLDELPQLWNVLKGEMSLVGPRPFPAYHLERFPSDFQALRARVRPRPYRPLAGHCQKRRRSRDPAGAGRLLHPQLVALARSSHPGAHSPRGSLRTRRVLSAPPTLVQTRRISKAPPRPSADCGG